MRTFGEILESYLRRGYAPDAAYLKAFQEYEEQTQDAMEFIYDHPEGVRL